MKISVVIPVYNTERYIAEAIDSVLAQSRPPDEIIVVDDGSTDRTLAILAQFVPRIVVVRQAHSGPAIALNRGIMRATGDYLAFNDADDIWLPEKLLQQCALMSNEPEIDAVFGAVRQFISADWMNQEGDIADGNNDQPGVCRAAMLIRRRAFDWIGPFDQAFRFVDFIDWYGRANALGLRVRMVPDVVVLRRIHATNTGRTHREAQRNEDLLALKRLLDMRRRGSRRAATDAGLQFQDDQTTS
jgi:glycosyltransferase involved in cell wall biosynthesis